ncbi:hypothetical protein Ga0080574_TMP2354 [Salipiger abyssi]|uniref:Uncharacterized protein n=1 Tax=Salipiger abyssi TaxID=1250539 RepID=A0A1P8UTK0_9RHOB|nr:hypothetical protein Ga0080574_TMP2354 [Salipiger abyssi]
MFGRFLMMCHIGLLQSGPRFKTHQSPARFHMTAHRAGVTSLPAETLGKMIFGGATRPDESSSIDLTLRNVSFSIRAASSPRGHPS